MSDRDLNAARRLTSLADDYRNAWMTTINARNNAIRSAINNGETMYRIAKEIGLTETAVRKIRDK